MVPTVYHPRDTRQQKRPVDVRIDTRTDPLNSMLGSLTHTAHQVAQILASRATP